MNIKIRQVDIHHEREELLDILRRNYNVCLDLDNDRMRYSWLYLDNPAGNAWAWFAYEADNGKLVGLSSLFPRAVWIRDELFYCGAVGDFAVDPNYRSLGPALKLQRATFDPVKKGYLTFCYDCPPHDTGMSTFIRLGMQANLQMHRYARPIKIDRQLSKLLGQKRWVASLALTGNFLLKMLHLLALHRHQVPGVHIQFHCGQFGEEFSLLDQRCGEIHNLIRSRRTAEDLNWRYRKNPLIWYKVLTAHRRGELLGYVIFYLHDQNAYIADLFVPDNPNVIIQLLDAVAQYVKKKSVQTIHLFISEGFYLNNLLWKAQYRYRSLAERVVAYSEMIDTTHVLSSPDQQWLFTYSDISTSPRQDSRS